jgi:hypothetical protein
MNKPLQMPAVIAPMEDRPRGLRPCNSAAFLIPLNIPKAGAVSSRELVVEHKPGKPSIILLKIMAMERYSGNVERLNRRRQFAKRYVAPLKASVAGSR